jgi:Rod binding domain-containing protein
MDSSPLHNDQFLYGGLGGFALAPLQRSVVPTDAGASSGIEAKGPKEVEGYFIGYLLQVMRQTVPKGLFGKSLGEQFYSFYDQEIGRLAAERGGFGLAAMIEADLRAKGPTRTEQNLSSSDGRRPIEGPR